MRHTVAKLLFFLLLKIRRAVLSQWSKKKKKIIFLYSRQATTSNHKHNICFFSHICLSVFVLNITFSSRSNKDKEVTKNNWFRVIYIDVIREHRDDYQFAQWAWPVCGLFHCSEFSISDWSELLIKLQSFQTLEIVQDRGLYASRFLGIVTTAYFLSCWVQLNGKKNRGWCRNGFL